MTTTVTYTPLAFEDVLAACKIARSIADPLAVVYLIVPRQTDGTEPRFEVCKAEESRPDYETTYFAYELPIAKSFTDTDIRTVATRWVQNALSGFMFPYNVEIVWDAESLRLQRVQKFVHAVEKAAQENDIVLGNIVKWIVYTDKVVPYELCVESDQTLRVQPL